jgi:HAD superfamily hydrolase (TIGR01484 family)
MASAIWLCSDLDRTILPNGFQEESSGVRSVLRRLAERPEMTLVYVTGRNKALILDAIKEFTIPVPDYAIGDVGATLYSVGNGGWKPAASWSQHIGKDWRGSTGHDIAGLLENLDELRLQESEKQNRYKLSYYTDPTVDHRRLVEKIQHRLRTKGIAAGVIWSIDETNGIGLIDILPERANKLHAIEFLLQTQGIPEQRAVFAGDSGNDLNALTSGLQSILVKNAAEDVRKEAIEILLNEQMTDRLYQARGDFFGMNGNYTAGVLEGLAHFFPETEQWIREAIR